MTPNGTSRKFTVFFCGVLSSLFLVFIVYSQNLTTQLTDYSHNIINSLGKSADEAFRTLDLLNAGKHTACTEENLLFMRKIQFESNDTKDIGFFRDNNIICTTGAGVLKQPIWGGTPDHQIDDYKIWFNHKLKTFDDTINGVVVKKDNYNIVLSFRALLLDYNAFENYEIVALLNGKTKHLFGSQNMFKNKPRENQKVIEVGLFQHKVELCGTRELICIAIHQEHFSEFQKTSLILILLIVLLLSGFSAVHFYNDVTKYLNSHKRRVKSGIKNQKFVAHYQPIIDLETGQAVGCEMLARFTDSFGSMYPDEFIPIVSEVGLSWPMTEQLMKQAIVDLKDVGEPQNPVYLSINIYPKDINNQNVLKAIDIIRNCTANITFAFEVTEDEALDFKVATPVLKKLVAAGVKISIDDFGTGYSNMYQLKSFEIDTLKIDKSFVDEVETGSIRSTLIPNIVSIADKLGATVIAEGVENILQVDALLKMNIRRAQGWHYAKAMPAAAFRTYFTDHQKATKY